METSNITGFTSRPSVALERQLSLISILGVVQGTDRYKNTLDGKPAKRTTGLP